MFNIKTKNNMKKHFFLLVLMFTAVSYSQQTIPTNSRLIISKNAEDTSANKIVVKSDNDELNWIHKDSLKSMIGLDSVDNTSDVNKPVSIAVQASLDTKIDTALINANNGVAPLDAGGKVPFSNLPAALMIYKGMWTPDTNLPTLADGTGVAGWVYKVTANGSANLGSGSISFLTGDFVIHNGTNWERSVGADNVVSVNGQQGVVSLTTANISDSTNKRYQTDAQQTYNDATSSIQTQLNAKATDAAVVHLANNETITGIKTFSSMPVLGSGSGTDGQIVYADAANKLKTITNFKYNDATGALTTQLGTLGSNAYTSTAFEPAFSKNTAFNKNFGTTAGTVAQGDDSRLLNGQTAYSWGSHAGLYLPLTGNSLTTSRLRNFGSQADANNLSGGGAMWYYGQGNIKSNTPADFVYGSVFQFNSQDTNDLSLQIANSINHDDVNSTRELYFRSQNNLGWQNDWKTVLHDGNYNSYSPTLTGTGAAGTWGINISGNAGSATNLTNQWLNTGVTFADTYNSLGNEKSSTNFIYNTTDAPLGNVGLYSITTIKKDSSYGSMLALNIEPGASNLYVKTLYGGTWGSWRTILDNSNFSSYALPLTGGTVTGELESTYRFKLPGMFIGYWDGINNRIENTTRPMLFTSYGNNIKFGFDGLDDALVLSQATNGVKMKVLAGTGTRIVTADSQGNLSAITNNTPVNGTFTPSNSGNITFLKSYYTRVGNILTIQLNMQVNITASSTGGTAAMTMPNSYTTANISVGRVVGSNVLTYGSNTATGGLLVKEATNTSQLDIIYGGTGLVVTNHYCSATIQVEVN